MPRMGMRTRWGAKASSILKDPASVEMKRLIVLPARGGPVGVPPTRLESTACHEGGERLINVVFGDVFDGTVTELVDPKLNAA